MKKCKLGDITLKIGSGATPRGGEKTYLKKGIAFVRSQNVQDFYFDYSNLAFINETQAKQLANVEIQRGDILLNITGDSIARCVLVPEDILPARVSQHVAIIRCCENINTKYIMYYLQYLKKYLLSICKIGGTRNALTKEMIENLPITINDNADKIADVLYTIDQKIEINKKINATLEAMAKLIYEYYFFKRPTNAVLGDIIIENKKSSIPVGEAKNIKGDYPFFTSGDSVLQWTKALVDGRNIFLHTGGNSGVKFFVGKAAYSTDTWCITAKNNLADYLYLFLKTIQVEIDKKFFAGTALKHLQKDLLKMREIYIPTESELEKLNAEIQPGFTMIAKNLMENRKLAEYRDFLLPLFMNGQISFK